MSPNPLLACIACSVLYLTSVETESLTGPQAVARASSAALSCSPRPTPAVVHFKVSAQGITLTDNQRKYVCRAPGEPPSLDPWDPNFWVIPPSLLFTGSSFAAITR